MTRTKRPRPAVMTPAEFVTIIESASLTPSEAAVRLSVTRQTVWRWMTGRTPISRQGATFIRSVIRTRS